MIKNTYYNAIRSHVDLLARRGRYDRLVKWQVGADEIHDPTLIAQRVYGNRDYADIVMICAGTNRIGQPLPKRMIFLPLATSVMAIRRQHNMADYE